MMAKKISVIIKEPGKNPRHVNISGSLENLQRTVGGYIETHQIASDTILICDEEGRFKGYEHCCWVADMEFVGTVIFAGTRGEEITDFPLDFAKFKILFPSLWTDEPVQQSR